MSFFGGMDPVANGLDADRFLRDVYMVNARVGDIDRLVGDADKVEGLSVSVPVQDRERRSRRCRDQTHEVDQLSVDLA